LLCFIEKNQVFRLFLQSAGVGQQVITDAPCAPACDAGGTIEQPAQATDHQFFLV